MNSCVVPGMSAHPMIEDLCSGVGTNELVDISDCKTLISPSDEPAKDDNGVLLLLVLFIAILINNNYI